MNHPGAPHEPPGNPHVQAGEDVKTATATDPLAAPELRGPFSWLLTRDVEQGRDQLNFSTWEADGNEAGDVGDRVADASMPLRRYLLADPDAALSDAERQVLVEALQATDANRAGRGRGRGGGDGSGG